MIEYLQGKMADALEGPAMFRSEDDTCEIIARDLKWTEARDRFLEICGQDGSHWTYGPCPSVLFY